MLVDRVFVNRVFVDRVFVDRVFFDRAKKKGLEIRIAYHSKVVRYQNAIFFSNFLVIINETDYGGGGRLRVSILGRIAFTVNFKLSLGNRAMETL